METAIIVISDDIPELIENCNRIIVMKQGRLTGEYSNKKVTEQELMSAVTAQKEEADEN